MPSVKKITVMAFSVMFIVSVVSILLINVSQVKADAWDGNYYGYGDSIMHAGFNGDKCFVDYMVENNDPPITKSDHNLDGNGRTSVWGLEEFSSHCTDMGNYMIEQFGVNDVKNINYISALNIAQNKMAMYNFSYENSSHTHYIPCIPTLADPTYEQGNGESTQWRPWTNQCDAINVTEEHFIRYSIKFCPLYDCLDSDPFNGRRDAWSGTYYDGNVHPTAAGHVVMGDWLWYFINDEDYTETYHSGNDTITIDADYNETIYVYPQDGWNVNNIVLTCETNDTEMTFDIGEDIEGETTIQFDILKGSYYTLTEQPVMSFRYIDNKGNNSISYNKAKPFDWIKSNNTVRYQLQVANDTGFTDIYINISNINETNYGSNYYEYTIDTVDYVHFNCTSEVNYGWKYYRVRAYKYE